MSSLKFLADSMLGTLARRLRLLGIDTVYPGNAEESQLKYVARSQDRVLLTRDLKLARSLGPSAWLVSGGDVREEFLSIAANLSSLRSQINPLSRCLDCNDHLLSMDPGQAEGRVPPYILQSKSTFSRCPSCGKVFWEGTHSEKMGEEVAWMRRMLEEFGDGG
ncbi:MAG: Mut7-C RNAse domain-containing protein [bacterium]|nr:MAG: Mut7-C RNAse domain-containing protein [bacterium]